MPAAQRRSRSMSGVAAPAMVSTAKPAALALAAGCSALPAYRLRLHLQLWAPMQLRPRNAWLMSGHLCMTLHRAQLTTIPAGDHDRPLYKGQYACFTHVHIGNTGINFGEPACIIHPIPSNSLPGPWHCAQRGTQIQHACLHMHVIWAMPTFCSSMACVSTTEMAKVLWFWPHLFCMRLLTPCKLHTDCMMRLAKASSW
jgi:hypothetical protein